MCDLLFFPDPVCYMPLSYKGLLEAVEFDLELGRCEGLLLVDVDEALHSTTG